MSPFDWMVLTISLASVGVMGASFFLALAGLKRREDDLRTAHHEEQRRWLMNHEAKAEEREGRAIVRHDAEMKALEHNRRIMLAAIDHRERLSLRVAALERIADDHAGHLVALGRSGALAVPVESKEQGMISLSEHFSLAELTVTSQVDEWGKPLPNQPDSVAMECLRHLCAEMLEPIRVLWDCPIRVTSGYRSHDVEMKVSGKDYGQHRLGQAADIQPTGLLNIVIAYERVWASALPYDQLIIEQANGARWIHVSYAAERAPRRMALYSPDGRSYDFYRPGVVPGPTEGVA